MEGREDESKDGGREKAETMRDRSRSMGIDFVCLVSSLWTHTFTHAEGTVSAVSERDR